MPLGRAYAHTAVLLATVLVAAVAGCPPPPPPIGVGSPCAASGQCPDPLYCDAASRTCERCRNGDQVGCGSRCVRLDVDTLNCGNCDVACGVSASLCQEGRCVPRCDGGLVECGGSACVDTWTDRMHCGDCDVDCGDGSDCVGGLCACGGGRFPCGSDCVDLSADEGHCGSCGQSCGSDEFCVAGECRQFVPVMGCVACPCVGCDQRCCDVAGMPFAICLDGSGCP